MGMVYRAYDRELKETVAIKVLRPDLARQSGRIERRFRSEIRLARRVRHRNVCSVYGDGEDRGLLYICMELIEGENLVGVVRSAAGLPEAEAWDVARQVADGLRAIHDAGIVHRDLKTANLMRDRRGVVRVMDFGIAKHHLGATGGHTVTATGTLMGTPEYMSPEQLRGDSVDFRGDLYSFGVVLYELFTGTLPFRGDTPVATILRQLQDEADLSHERLPPRLRPVLRRALAKTPAGRYARAEDMRRALHAALGDSALRPAPEQPDEAAVPPADETRPLEPFEGPRERPPVARIATGLLAVTALGLHLLAAGGVARATPIFIPRPIGSGDIQLPAPSPEPAPVPESVSRRVARARPAPAPIPAATPTPPPVRPVVAEPVVVHPPTRGPAAIEPNRVYEEDEVDVPPHRIQGHSAPYPDWGPELGRGQRASITATFVVTEEGDVTDIEVEKGGGALEAVLIEISRWKFEPGLKDGIPVKVRMRSSHAFIGG
jgi:hypothetical protein